MKRGIAPAGAKTPTPLPARANVLIVDDHPSNLLALEGVLAPLGHNLVRARSGEEALKLMLKHDFALVLLDVQLEGLNGYDVAALLKQHVRSRDVPVIFITGVNLESSHVARGYSEGAVDYLVKPIDPEILRQKAQVFIDLYLKREGMREHERRLRERQREALERKLEVRYRGLIDSMPHAMWAARPDGTMYYWNHAALQYTGLDAATVDDAKFWSIIHDADRDPGRSALAAAIADRRSFEAQCRIRRASDGEYRWHLVRAVPEIDEAGELVGWIATATDIDDQKRAEAELQKALALRDEFLSVASHELRTPLTSLKLTSVAVTRQIERCEGVVERPALLQKLTRLESSVNRLSRLVDLLLDVSRISAGRIELELEETDLGGIVKEVCDRFREEQVDRTPLDLRVNVEGPVIGRWDRDRLDQLVTNLVSNALKYGAGKPVEVSVMANDAAAQLTVRDQGIGIAPEDHPRIFERFERAEGARSVSGIGLGLWIVREIVRIHGGTVDVRSAPNQGAEFTVRLPYGMDGQPSHAPREPNGAAVNVALA